MSNQHNESGYGADDANVLLDQVQAALDDERFADANTLIGLLSPARLDGVQLMRYYYLHGWISMILKRLDEAWSEFTHALNWADRLKDRATAIWSRYRLGVIHYRNHQFADAERYFITCWVMIYDYGRRIDDPKLKAYVNHSLGNATLRQGRFKNAVGHYLDALKQASDFDSSKWVGSVCWGLGLAHFYQGDLGVAKVEIGEALRLQQQEPVNSFLARINGMYGMILIELNQPLAAERELTHTIFLSKRVDDNTTLVSAYSNMAEAYLAQGRLPDALTYAEQALVQAYALGVAALDVAQTQQMLAKVYGEQGSYEQAAMLMAEAETTMRGSGDLVKYMQLLYEYGRLLKKAGNYSGAVQKLTLACYLRNPGWRYLLAEYAQPWLLVKVARTLPMAILAWAVGVVNYTSARRRNIGDAVVACLPQSGEDAGCQCEGQQ